MKRDPQFKIRVYNVDVNGYGSSTIDAASKGKARAARRALCDALGYTYNFWAFLAKTTIQQIQPDARHEGFGQPILVAGEPAFRCLDKKIGYVRFVRPGATRIFWTRPGDVKIPLQTERTEP